MSAASLRPIHTIGFIGLGVMGEPMCGHLARRSGRTVLAHDLRPEPLARLAEFGVTAATPAEHRPALRPDPALPARRQSRAGGDRRIGAASPPGSASSIPAPRRSPLTRAIGERLTARGIGFADAPVARTREAAATGKLSIMVGATEATFAHVRPILETMGSDVTHCGPVGCGQVVKILNNMLVFQNTAALAEAIALGRRNGVPAEMLLQAMALGSGDSFALRNHGMKSMLPQVFPERAFSTRYAMKDLSYALEMAEAAGIEVPGAQLTMQRLREAERQGHGEEYHPVVLRVIDPA